MLRYAPRATSDLYNWTNTEIEIFYVRYLQITGSSGFGGAVASFQEATYPKRSQCPGGAASEVSCPWTDREAANKFFPDIAVPIELAPNFGIAAGNNQSIWIDIYIPRTATAGTYTGVMISEGGTTTKTIPVSLVVRIFTLPDTTELHDDAGFRPRGSRSRYGSESAANEVMKKQVGVAIVTRYR